MVKSFNSARADYRRDVQSSVVVERRGNLRTLQHNEVYTIQWLQSDHLPLATRTLFFRGSLQSVITYQLGDEG